MKVGIPRALYYYLYPRLWEAYFSSLGFETVVSKNSTLGILNMASAVTETEHCLPNKFFDGHFLSLVGKADLIFVPRIISMAKGYIACPKFGALPDSIMWGVGHGVEILTIDIDETREPLSVTLKKLALKLGCSKSVARSAVKEAFVEMRQLQQEQVKKNLSLPEDRFLLMGHPYTLNDSFIAGPIVKKLNKEKVFFEIMTFEEKLSKPEEILWCTFKKMNDRLSSLDMNVYKGIIFISTFNCGADSMMLERFRRLAMSRGIPFLVIMVDEHTGKAGVETRLEAFIDSLEWRNCTK